MISTAPFNGFLLVAEDAELAAAADAVAAVFDLDGFVVAVAELIRTGTVFW